MSSLPQARLAHSFTISIWKEWEPLGVLLLCEECSTVPPTHTHSLAEGQLLQVSHCVGIPEYSQPCGITFGRALRETSLSPGAQGFSALLRNYLLYLPCLSCLSPPKLWEDPLLHGVSGQAGHMWLCTLCICHCFQSRCSNYLGSLWGLLSWGNLVLCAVSISMLWKCRTYPQL